MKIKKKISALLMKAALRLYPAIKYEYSEDARPMGLCVHIGKKDVRDFRKSQPEIKSHREGMKQLIEEAKYRIAGAIARGLMDKGLIRFEVRRTLFTADVTGIAFVFGGEKEAEEQEKA